MILSCRKVLKGSLRLHQSVGAIVVGKEHVVFRLDRSFFSFIREERELVVMMVGPNLTRTKQKL